MLNKGVLAGLLVCGVVAGAANGALTFSPAPGYSATPIWSGADASHFAVDDGDVFVYGATEVGGGQYQNEVRWYDGASTVTIASSDAYSGTGYSPDAITAVNGAVYWAHAASYLSGGAATLYRTSYDGANWNTSTVFDGSAGINVFSLSTDGERVFGVGLDAGGNNVAFYLDDSETYQVFAEIPEYSGGSGFDSQGNFYAGAADSAFSSHMYAFTAAQVADRVGGVQATPYSISDAVDDLLVPGNGSPVMESDGALIYGVNYNGSFTGTDPFAFDVASGDWWSLGTLSGADAAVTSDMYARDGDVYFMAKNAWGNGSEAIIYRLVPEPASVMLLALGATVALARRRRDKAGC